MEGCGFLNFMSLWSSDIILGYLIWATKHHPSAIYYFTHPYTPLYTHAPHPLSKITFPYNHSPVHLYILYFIHSLTHPCSYFTHLPTHTSTHPSNHPLTHPFINYFTPLPTNLFIHPFTQPPTNSFIHPSPTSMQLLYLVTHSFIHPSIHPTTHSPIHLLTQLPTCSFLHPSIHPSSIHSSVISPHYPLIYKSIYPPIHHHVTPSYKMNMFSFKGPLHFITFQPSDAIYWH